MVGPGATTRGFEVPHGDRVRVINYLDDVQDPSGFYVNRRQLGILDGHFSQEMHPQVEIHHPDGTFAWVDVGMARIISGLWKLGVDTSFSCQGPEQRYLVVRKSHRFVARDYLERMGEIIFRDEPGGSENIGSWYFQMMGYA